MHQSLVFALVGSYCAKHLVPGTLSPKQYLLSRAEFIITWCLRYPKNGECQWDQIFFVHAFMHALPTTKWLCIKSGLVGEWINMKCTYITKCADWKPHSSSFAYQNIRNILLQIMYNTMIRQVKHTSLLDCFYQYLWVYLGSVGKRLKYCNILSV